VAAAVGSTVRLAECLTHRSTAHLVGASSEAANPWFLGVSGAERSPLPEALPVSWRRRDRYTDNVRQETADAPLVPHSAMTDLAHALAG